MVTPSRAYRFLVAVLAVLWSCSAKLDMDGDIAAGQETSIDWMTPLPDDTPFARLSIPGAHDAATSTVTTFTAWTRTQDLNVARLWNCGVRAFDLRPAWVDGVMGIYHDKYSAHVSLPDVLRALSLAMEKHPGECAVVVIRHEEEADGNTPEWPAAMASCLAEFSDVLASWHQGITLGEMRGKILVLSRNIYDGGPIGGYIRGWTSGVDIASQKGASIIDKDGNASPLWVQDYYDPEGKDDKWSEVKDMLDAAASASEPFPLIINHVSGYVGSLPDYRSNARDINALAADYIRESGSPAGIVMMDFAGVSRSRGVKLGGDILVNALIDNNRPYRFDPANPPASARKRQSA